VSGHGCSPHLPDLDAIRALRAALKVLLRRFGLKAIEVKEDQNPEGCTGFATKRPPAAGRPK
jgi:hypothetical protein